MLTRIEIDGFKSFTNFSMDFSPLTLIAGLNASGKSNLFDALHLLSLLAALGLMSACTEKARQTEPATTHSVGQEIQQLASREKSLPTERVRQVGAEYRVLLDNQLVSGSAVKPHGPAAVVSRFYTAYFDSVYLPLQNGQPPQLTFQPEIKSLPGGHYTLDGQNYLTQLDQLPFFTPAFRQCEKHKIEACAKAMQVKVKV